MSWYKYTSGFTGGGSLINSGLLNVPAAGTRQQLPNITIQEVTVIAKKSNTGSIYVGGFDVASTKYGIELGANEGYTFLVTNTNLIWIDASISGEGISYIAII